MMIISRTDGEIVYLDAELIKVRDLHSYLASNILHKKPHSVLAIHVVSRNLYSILGRKAVINHIFLSST